MTQLLPLAYLFLCLVAGMALGKLRAFPRGAAMKTLMSLSLYALLFFMGFRIGRNEEVGRNIATIGLLSISTAVAAVAGTLAVLSALFAATGRGRGLEPPEDLSAAARAGSVGPAADGDETVGVAASGMAEASAAGVTSIRVRGSSGASVSEAAGARTEAAVRSSGRTETVVFPANHFREPLRLFAIVVAGFFTGLVRGLFPALSGENISTWLLYLLILLVGADMVQSGVSVKRVLAHPETLLLPAGTVVGSLLGGLALAAAFGLPVGKALALSSGFGWYSLSGVIITDLGDPVLGSAGFMANMLRETIALLSIPLLARTRLPYLGIGVAGATSMDVSLPLIERTCGPASAPLAIASGAILSLMVPVLVPLFYQLG